MLYLLRHNFKIILILLGVIFTTTASVATETVPLEMALADVNTLLIAQELQTPASSALLVSPQNFDPLDVYKEVVKAYQPFKAHPNAGLIVADGYLTLAKTLLHFIHKRCLYLKGTNLENIFTCPEEIDVCLKDEKNDLAHKLRTDIAQRAMVEPIFVEVEDASERQQRERDFSPYFTYFSEEIDWAQRHKQHHYAWFMQFCDYLSDLASSLTYHSFADINTQYPHYLLQIGLKREDLKKPGKIHDPSRYRIGNYITDTVLSLPSLTADCPGTVMLPYLFALTPIDFLNLSVNGEQLFWPCGFAFRPIAVDGWYHCPRMFFGHDWHHKAIINFGTQCLVREVADLDEMVSAKAYSEYAISIQNKHLMYIETLQTLYAALSQLPDSDEKTVFSFLSFLLMHESSNNVTIRLAQLRKLLHFDYRTYPMGGIIDSYQGRPYRSNWYYKGLLPESLQNVSEHQFSYRMHVWEEKFSQYLKNFTSDEFKWRVDYALSMRLQNKSLFNEFFSYRPDRPQMTRLTKMHQSDGTIIFEEEDLVFINHRGAFMKRAKCGHAFLIFIYNRAWNLTNPMPFAVQIIGGNSKLTKHLAPQIVKKGTKPSAEAIYDLEMRYRLLDSPQTSLRARLAKL